MVKNAYIGKRKGKPIELIKKWNIAVGDLIQVKLLLC